MRHSLAVPAVLSRFQYRLTLRRRKKSCLEVSSLSQSSCSASLYHYTNHSSRSSRPYNSVLSTVQFYNFYHMNLCLFPNSLSSLPSTPFPSLPTSNLHSKLLFKNIKILAALTITYNTPSSKSLACLEVNLEEDARGEAVGER